MKKLILTSFLILNYCAVFAQQDFSYQLVVKSAKGAQVNTLYIAYEVAGTKHIDSVQVRGAQSR
jgi:hypothetical protein